MKTSKRYYDSPYRSSATGLQSQREGPISQKEAKITSETSDRHQILIKRQGSYNQQIPRSIFTSTHRGRHRRAKVTFSRRNAIFRGDRSSQNETQAVSGTTQSRRLARVPAARPAAGQPHFAILKIAHFLVIIILCNQKVCRLSPPRVFAPHTRDVCQIDRLHRESCASILLRDKLCSLIDINLLVN